MSNPYSHPAVPRVRPFVLSRTLPLARPTPYRGAGGTSGVSSGFWRFTCPGVRSCLPRLSSPPLSPRSSLGIMILLYLFLAAFSCLSFAGAEPFHVPLMRRREPLSIEDYANAGNALRIKYGYTSSPSKRQNTATIPIIDQVSITLPCKPLPRVNNNPQSRDSSYLGTIQIGTPCV